MNHDILILPGGQVIHDPTCKKGIHTIDRDRYKEALEEIVRSTAPLLEWFNELSVANKSFVDGGKGFMIHDIKRVHDVATEALNGSTTGTQRSDSAEHGTTD
jgi:hypothetical protein